MFRRDPWRDLQDLQKFQETQPCNWINGPLCSSFSLGPWINMLNTHLLFLSGFSLYLWPRPSGNPTRWWYLSLPGKLISAQPTDWKGNCHPPPGQGISHLGASFVRDGKSPPDLWNVAPREGQHRGRSPSLPCCSGSCCSTERATVPLVPLALMQSTADSGDLI